jgi:hypothetical protein
MNTENGQDVKEYMNNVGTESGSTSYWQLEEIRITDTEKEGSIGSYKRRQNNRQKH